MPRERCCQVLRVLALVSMAVVFVSFHGGRALSQTQEAINERLGARLEAAEREISGIGGQRLDARLSVIEDNVEQLKWMLGAVTIGVVVQMITQLVGVRRSDRQKR